MISSWSFLNDSWLWIVIIIAVSSLMLFAWKERDSYGSTTFLVRIGVSFFAIAFLALIALKPQTHIEKDGQVAVILTPEFNELQLDSLKQEYKGLKTFAYSKGEILFNSDNTPSAVFVLGNGIQDFDLWQLSTIAAQYLGGNDLQGVTHLKYNTQELQGNRLALFGSYANPKAGNQLVLKDPGGNALDSVTLTNNKSQLFQLGANLNVLGNFNYQVTEKDSLGQVLTQDIVPITVVEKQPLKVLILNGFPTFETKYLKNFLAETGHQVVVKNQITTARYKYEYFNMDKKPKVNITQENLSYFDLLIIDTKSLNGLSTVQQNTLKNVVKDHGLGVFIQPDAGYFSGNKPLVTFSFNTQKSKDVALAAYPKERIKKYDYQFKQDFLLEAINRSDSQIWSAYRRLGLGRVGTTVFRNTFELVLNGQTKTYQAIWSKILAKVSKPKDQSLEWASNNNLAYVNRPFKFKLRTSITNPTVVSNNADLIALQQDANLASLWSGKDFPRQVGWKQLRVSQDSSAVYNYYVSDTLHWKTLNNYNTIALNNSKFNSNTMVKSSPVRSLKLVNPLWFFAGFVICVGYLWLVPKL